MCCNRASAIAEFQGDRCRLRIHKDLYPEIEKDDQGKFCRRKGKLRGELHEE